MTLYFAPELDNEICYTLDIIKDMMRCQKIKQTDIIKAKRDTGEPFFYCKHFGEVGEVGEGCGKICKAYEPRNGKNGRCRHSTHTYSKTNKIRALKI